ncbi:MAG TPA: hypothetical protein VLJ88_08660, partial [Propionibacteriaceae bacterium]|nr:hypothetical protein [Propionibacteriaceae bacterium]
AELHALWADVGAADLVQVAEQYPLMPLPAARLRIVRAGVIGTATSVLVSSTHLYHAVALMRQFLQVGRDPVTVTARTFSAELVDPITPDGWTHDTELKPAETTLAWIDFGSGRMGRYDFTDNQWWNPVRPDHLVVRGSVGEIFDDTVVRMVDEVTPVTSRIERSMSGLGMNYEGMDLTHLSLDGRVVFRNEYEGGRLSDDDVGVAVLLDQMGGWTRNESPPPYPLAEACHDHAIGLAIGEASASGETVQVGDQPWR